MENPEIGARLTKADLARFWQALRDKSVGRPPHFRCVDRKRAAQPPRLLQICSKTGRDAEILRQKSHSWPAAARDGTLRSGIVADFDDNAD